MTGQTLGHYRILQKIGEGGMGVVYRARDERLERDVALKVLPPGALADEAARRRFRKEALALSQLNHPNIATVHDFDTQDGVDFLVMEWIPGVTVAEKIGNDPLTEKEFHRLALQLADGLAAAHEQGVAHRDLKPGNLRVTPDGWLKILDFGLAKLLRPASDAAGTATLTETQAVAGTLPYMPPEQLRGEPTDGRSDIYAAGAVLYEMATGRRAFPQTNGPLLIDAILNQVPAPLPAKLAPALQSLILKALDKDPGRRYQSARELRVDLERLAAPPPATASPRPVRRPWILAAAAAAIVLLLVAGWLLWNRKEAPSGRITLAVLPFHAQAVPQEARFLGVGIADAIITRLAGVGGLAPRPTSAILRYENQPVDAKQAGEALASEYVLTGILQQSAERLRVSVQLVRAKDAAPVWGKQYELARADLLTLQDSIAEQVAEALKIQMTAAERARFYRRYTDNRAAYESYLQGRSQMVRATGDGMRAAVDAFEGALRQDPNYVLAHAGIAQASAVMRIRFAPEGEVKTWEERAEREARRALELDPNLAEAHAALAAAYWATEFNWDGMIEESRRALDLNPNLDQPHYYRAGAFYHLGLLELVEPEVRSALEINPASTPDASRTRGLTALFSGKFDEALRQFLELSRLTKASSNDFFLGYVYYYVGNPSRAKELLAARQGSTVQDRRAQAVFASVLAATGERARAEALLRLLAGLRYPDHHVAYSVASAYAQLGKRGEALHWLREAVRTGLPCYPWYERDPLLNPMRRDPEFQKFLAELRASWEAAKRRHG